MDTKRIQSGAPFVVIGIGCVVYALLMGLAPWYSYVGLVILCFLLYAPLKKYFPDRFVVVETPPNSGNASCDQLILESRATLNKIYQLRTSIQRDALTEKIDRIEGISRQILLALAKQPEMQGQLRSFLRYYLPTTYKLLQVRAEILRQGKRPSQAAQKTLERIDSALNMIYTACEKQLNALDQFQYLSIETEMDVLDDMLRKDGLIDEVGKRPHAEQTTAKPGEQPTAK